MKRASLNHSFRLVWNDRTSAYVAVPESAKGRGKSSWTIAALALIAPALSFGAPTGGVVMSGSAAISQSGTVTNITQGSQKATINWQGFSIAGNETVNFNQPNSSAITLNRVVGNERSVINGAMNANGQVFLINSNGVLFGQGASINVGGLVASTLNITDEDFNAGNYVFKGNGGGSILNLGTITAKDGGYVALLGKEVVNQGLIAATKGTVTLSAGEQISLNFNGDSLLSVTIDQGALNALVDNQQAIVADGGTVFLTAKAVDDLLGAQVNNSGIIQARTIDDLTGKIELFAHGGTANVAGTLDASAPTSGDGGFIETSGDQVQIADGAVITTKSEDGQSGTWLIDPTNFTIALGSGGPTTSSIGATTLATALTNSHVTITTSSSGSEAGDINVNAAVSWTSANALTLTAAGDINTNANMTWTAGDLNLNAGKNINVNSVLAASGTADISASWGNGSNSDGTPYSLYTLQSAADTTSLTGKVNFTSSGTVTLNGENYTVLKTYADLAKISDDLTGNYVLGMTGAVTTAGLDGALGTGTAFTGILEGFGHNVNLSYNTSTGKGVRSSGLFDTIGASGVVRNMGVGGTLADENTGTVANVGALANVNQGTILNVYGAATITSSLNYDSLGGLVGRNEGTISLASVAGNIYAANVAGGLVGTNASTGVVTLSNARYYPIFGATGATAISYVGGLVGINDGVVNRSWASQGIQLTDSTSIAGGLVGRNNGSVDQAYVARNSRYYSTGPNLSGFVGVNTGTITNSYSTMLYDDPNFVQMTVNGPVVGSWLAGFAYKNSGTIAASYATTYAYDSGTHAGFVYDNTGGSTVNDYWTSGLSSSAAAYGDNSTAKKLTAAQAAQFSSYAGFSSSVWSASASGYPILGNLPIYISATGVYGSAPVYTVLGLQGGGGIFTLRDNQNDSDSEVFYVLNSTGYIDAGANSAASVIGSNTYKNVRGLITVTPKALTFADGSVADKTYDGTTAATAGTVALVGLVGNQTLSITGLSGTFANANAGEDKTVTLTYTATDGSNGGKASNYTIATTAKATIDPKTLTVTADVADKTYDGTTTASVNSVGISGVVGSDVVSLDSYKVAFTDKNAGTDKSVYVTDAQLSGSSAGNYTIDAASAVATTADITPRVIQLYGSASEGGTTTIGASQLAVVNGVAGDTVSLSGSATIAGTATGLQSITSTSGLSASNPNYTLVGSVGSVMVGGSSLVLDHVASGSATVATNGATTTVTQTSDKAVIDWYRFSVASGETLNFVQPSSSAIILNRVTGNEASVIAGTLNANGRVFILNSNGVLFKAGSSVNVGALLASTLDIGNSDFLSGNYVFTSKGGEGSVIGEGAIVIVEGGFLALASENGVTAKGSIVAPGSTAILASAKELTLNLDGVTSDLDSYEVANLSGTTSVGGSINLRSGASNAATLETAGNALSIANDFAFSTRGGDTWSLSLPSINVASGSQFSGTWVNTQLSSINVALNALSGNVTLNNAISWSSDSQLTLSAAGDININKSITATGDHAGLVMNYGGEYTLLTKASYSGTVLDANGKPVADSAPAGAEYASITLSGDHAHLAINGNDYQLIHSVAQLDALDNCISGLCYDPVTGTYSKSGGAVLSYVANGMWWTSNNYVWNPVTQAYDIPISQNVGGTTYYYNLDTGAYDLTASYSGKTRYYYYDLTSAQYTHAAYSVAEGKYWNPSTGQYDLGANYGANIYYNPATGEYNIPGLDTATGKYYNPLTGLYELSSASTVAKLYYDVSDGNYDLSTQPTVSGYYALAGDLDASGTGYGDSLLYSFSGTLAGLGHVISNLTIDSSTSPTTGTSYKGMIDSAESSSVVRDLGLVNPVETFKGNNGATVATIWAAPLIGWLNGGVLSQVYVEGGSISVPNGTTGGLVSYATTASIADSYSSMSGASGGLVGRTSGGSIVRSHASGSSLLGGLVAAIYGGTLISYDYATGHTGATGSFNNIGGLIGLYNGGAGASNLIENSFATGSVDGAAPLGGLVGSLNTLGSGIVSIVNSYATGNVNASYPSPVTAVQGVGGLVGWGQGVSISDSFATGNVTTDANVSYTGGLIGNLTGTSSTPNTITNSYASGNVVSGTSLVGGLVGSAAYVTITNSHANGNVTGVNTVGGLVGSANNSTISNSYTTGLVTATKGVGLNTVVGGLVGNGSNLTISNSFYNQDLNANTVLGGFGNPLLGSSYRDGSKGLTTPQMADVGAYANGTIEQVLVARQEAAVQAANQAAAVRMQEYQAAGTQVAGREVAQRLQQQEASPVEQVFAQGEGFRSPATLLDQAIVFADNRKFSTDIRRIEVDGQVFYLEDESEGKTP